MSVSQFLKRVQSLRLVLIKLARLSHLTVGFNSHLNIGSGCGHEGWPL